MSGSQADMCVYAECSTWVLARAAKGHVLQGICHQHSCAKWPDAGFLCALHVGIRRLVVKLYLNTAPAL